jgi:hypothetical protein
MMINGKRISFVYKNLSLNTMILVNIIFITHSTKFDNLDSFAINDTIFSTFVKKNERLNQETVSSQNKRAYFLLSSYLQFQ